MPGPRLNPEKRFTSEGATEEPETTKDAEATVLEAVVPELIAVVRKASPVTSNGKLPGRVIVPIMALMLTALKELVVVQEVATTWLAPRLFNPIANDENAGPETETIVAALTWPARKTLIRQEKTLNIRQCTIGNELIIVTPFVTTILR